MKYTILGFQQEKLVKNKLDTTDALILRFIKDCYSTSSFEFIVEENTKYIWLNYTYMINQLPIVGTKRSLMRKIEKYGKDLLLLRILKHNKKGVKGNFSYVAPTPKLDGLSDYNLMTESHKGYDTNDIRVMTESHNKDSSLKDSSKKDNKEKIPPLLKDVSEYCMERKNGIDPQNFNEDKEPTAIEKNAMLVIERLNLLSGKKFQNSKTSMENIIARLKEGFSLDDCFRVLEIKIKDKYFIENPKYYAPTTLFRPSNFEKYLNELPAEKKLIEICLNSEAWDNSLYLDMEFRKTLNVSYVNMMPDFVADHEREQVELNTKEFIKKYCNGGGI